MASIQQILDRARYPLNDAAKIRWKDDELLAYYNNALGIATKKRPDLFWGQWAALPAGQDFDDAFPLSAAYEAPFQDYITARAKLKDDELQDEGVIAGLLQLFLGGLGKL